MGCFVVNLQGIPMTSVACRLGQHCHGDRLRDPAPVQPVTWYSLLLSRNGRIAVFMSQCYNLVLSDGAVGVAWGEFHVRVPDILMV